MTAPPPTTDTHFLRRALRDLVALSTLPAVWAGQEAVDIPQGLAAAILATFQPDLIFIRLHHLPAGQSSDILQLTGRDPTLAQQRHLQEQLAPYLAPAADGELFILPHPDGEGTLRARRVLIGRGGDDGVIVVGSRQSDFPAELDQLLLTVIANQAVIWSQQARVLAERAEAQLALTRLNELSRIFAAELNLDKLVTAITDGATQLIGAEFGAFFYDTVDQDGEHFTLYTLSGAPSSAFAEFPMPRNTPLFAPTFHGTGLVRSADIRQDARYGQLPPHFGMPPGHLPITSYLAVPVMARSGRPLGGLFFGHSQAGRFTERHEQLMVGLAAHAAVALDNAHLYQAEQQAREQLQVRVQARDTELLQSEARFHLLVNSVQDYAIYLLDPTGTIISWNSGASRIKGYSAEDVIGRNFSYFYTPQDVKAGKPAHGLQVARETGHFEAEGWRVRKDGSHFWANVAITPVRSESGELLGFAKVTRDLTERVQMEEQLRQSREQLRELSAHLEKAREQERTRIAREIHDELGGTLTGLKMDAAQLHRYMDPQGIERLEAFSQAINEAVKTVRRIATELRPAILDDFGLLAAMEWQLGEFERRSDLRCHWHCALEPLDISGESATSVFRVFQESLTNIARHAQATEVNVHCDQRDGELLLKIEDNGVGIAPHQIRGTRSLGLVGIRERVRQLGGSVDIHGRPGAGTTVEVQVPLAAH